MTSTPLKRHRVSIVGSDRLRDAVEPIAVFDESARRPGSTAGIERGGMPT